MCTPPNHGHNNHPSPRQRDIFTMRQDFQRHLSASGRDDLAQLSQRFGSLDSNCERVNFVCDLLKERNMDRIEFEEDRKCDETSRELRDSGNEMFRVRKLQEAFDLYTESVKWGVNSGENLGMAYANRSAVLFEAGKYDECLVDIDRALECNYPNNLHKKLLTRQQNAISKSTANSSQPYHQPLPIISDKNPEIQCATSSAISVNHTDVLGRHILATRPIKIGQILAIEQPVATFVIKSTNHCHNCTNLCWNPIPCGNCTQVVFCSPICSHDISSCHKHECNILRTCTKVLAMDKLKMLPLKIALRGNGNNCDQIHGLVANSDKRSVADLFERATYAAIIYNLVAQRTSVFSDGMSEDVFKDLLLLHLQTGPCNFHEISQLSSSDCGNFEPVEVASGAYAFMSLLNHSCCPNVARFCYGSTLVLVAIRSIAEGEQVFDNYGYHHALTPRSERRLNLKRQYFFDCDCIACVQDWSLYDNLPELQNSVRVSEEVMKKLAEGDVETARSCLQDLIDKLGVLEEFVPCKNFCRVQECVKQCLAIVGNRMVKLS